MAGVADRHHVLLRVLAPVLQLNEVVSAGCSASASDARIFEQFAAHVRRLLAPLCIRLVVGLGQANVRQPLHFGHNSNEVPGGRDPPESREKALFFVVRVGRNVAAAVRDACGLLD